MKDFKGSQNYLVLEGDYGGQIYVVIPKSLILCNNDVINILLYTLDDFAWENDEDANFYFRDFYPGDVVPGGMGGGMALDKEIWVHKEFSEIKNEIIAVILNLDVDYNIEKMSTKFN